MNQKRFFFVFLIGSIISLPSVCFSQFNNRLSVQGFLKSGTTALNDSVGYPIQFRLKKNSTVIWCQSSTAPVPVLAGVFSSILSGTSNCQNLSSTLNSDLFYHTANSDTFGVDIQVDLNKDGFGGADDAIFAGVDLIPTALSLSAHNSVTAQNVTGTVAVANGGTGATTAAAARSNLGLGNLAILSSSGLATEVLLGNGSFGPVPDPLNFTGRLAGDVTGTQANTLVGKIQGRDVASTAPSDGQALIWNNSMDRWEPRSVTNSVTSVAGKTGSVTLQSTDISDAMSANTPNRLVLRDANGNFAAGTVTASTLNSSGNLSVSTTSPAGQVQVAAGSASGTLTLGNASTGATLVGNTGANATTTLQSPVINIGSGSTSTAVNLGSSSGTSSTVIRAGSGKIQVGSNGTAFSSMGACTTPALLVSTTGVTSTCKGVPASTNLALHCTGSANFTSSSTALYCRPTGLANQIRCNTTLSNTISMTYTCLWMAP